MAVVNQDDELFNNVKLIKKSDGIQKLVYGIPNAPNFEWEEIAVDGGGSKIELIAGDGIAIDKTIDSETGKEINTIRRSFFFETVDVGFNDFTVKLSGYWERAFSNQTDGIIIASEREIIDPNVFTAKLSGFDERNFSNETAGILVVSERATADINNFTAELFLADWSNEILIAPTAV